MQKLKRVSICFIGIFLVFGLVSCGPEHEKTTTQKKETTLSKTQIFEKKIKEGNATTNDYYELGVIYYNEKQYKETVELMNAHIKLEKEPYIIAFCYRGQALYLMGETEKGLKDLLESADKGVSQAVYFMNKHKIKWDGPEKKHYYQMVSDVSDSTDCFQYGYKLGLCATKSMHGIQCKPENDIIMPIECRGKAETERGVKAGSKAVYDAM